MTRYQVFYRMINNSDIKIAVINAVTEQSARNRFEQMYHECTVVDIKEIQDEN